MKKTGRKVLIVDDMPTILQEAVSLIGDRYELETASNGREAIAKAKAFRPEIILCDMHMPDMNGITCMQAIHVVEGLEDVPVIMTMNDVSVITKARAYDHGAVDSLQKPFIRLNLFRKIDMHLKLIEVGWKFEL
jgi:two-component system NtrC family response regulator/two-component system KDP operon response regulator KdpE/two-component system response regulator AtoC